MSETVIIGYNTLIKVGGKTFAGVISDDFEVSAETKESITKADAGNKRMRVTRKPVTLAISGICSTDDDANVLSRKDIIELVGQTAEVDYDLGGGDTLSGSGLITNYKETTYADPEQDPTYSLNVSCINGLE